MWKKQTSFQVTIRGQNVRRLSESVQNSLDHACYKRCLSSSFDISHLRNITYQNYFILHCLLQKTFKKGQNTVFGYKKGSKCDLDIGSRSATPKMYMNILTTFFPKCSEHRKPEGGVKTHKIPPLRFLK